MRGYVGHFRVARQRHAELSRKPRRKHHAADQVFHVERLGVQAGRKGVPHQATIVDRLHDSHASLGGLPRPEDLFHRPTGKRPDEAVLGRHGLRPVADRQGVIDHRSAVFRHHVPRQVGVSDVEMGLEDHHDLSHRGGGRRCRAHIEQQYRDCRQTYLPVANARHGQICPGECCTIEE